MICPVCRSQNMETAKFCGSCGHAFPRPSEPTSSLVNCAKGHIYSAVYQQCPYCPQVAGVIPTLETTVVPLPPSSDPPAGAPAIPVTTVAPIEDFITRLGDEETMIAELGLATTITPQPVDSRQQPTLLDNSATEVIPIPVSSRMPIEETVIAPLPPQIPPPPPPRVPPQPPSPGVVVTPFPTVSRPVDAVTKPEQRPTPDPFNHKKPVITPRPLVVSPPAEISSSETDRKTVVVPIGASTDRPSKGKIVGWLISYSNNPDGVDYRIYAGYNRLGANPACDIIIDDETVSGSHAVLVYRDGRCMIKDDLSRNGTFVNDREITEAHQLQNYDQVRVGNTQLTYISAQRI